MEATLERAPREGDCELCVMDATGDTKIIWNPADDFETKNAREQFEKHKKQGYVIYKVDPDGDSGEVMHSFDPNAAKMIARQRVVGG